MRWHDIDPAGGHGPWQGLAITVETPSRRTAGPPGLCVRAGSGRLRVDVGSNPRVWARVHRYLHGAWTLVADDTDSPGIIDPIRTREIRAIQAQPGSLVWWKLWARDFAERLSRSPRSPLYPGRFTLSPGTTNTGPKPALPGPPLFSWKHLLIVERVDTFLDEPPVQWQSYWTNGSGAALRLRSPSAPDASRVKALRKLAREGVMPPLLFYFVSGLDMFVLLDGHDRLRALLLEGAPIPLFILTAVMASPRAPSPRQQEAILLEIERRSVPGASRQGPLPVPTANNLLIQAFDDRPYLWTRTRAYPLLGGAARWAEEVRDTFGLAPQHRAFSGEPPER